MKKQGQAATVQSGQAETHLLPVVAIGASAGGLEAVRTLLAFLPADTGCAYVLIQHLDPNHKSMMVELLSRETKMAVYQAADGMPLERNCFYVIPPHAFLSVQNGTLRLSKPEGTQGVRLPYDHFLESLAADNGKQTACVVLSGTGADGSQGLKLVSDNGGLVIAQDPNEAAYDGMPAHAIETGSVRLVLPLAKIPQALVSYAEKGFVQSMPRTDPTDDVDDESLATVITLLREGLSQDFGQYKRGTMVRRIFRRMAVISVANVKDYIQILHTDPSECNALAGYLLIHVTRFFRDLDAFEALARTAIFDLVQSHTSGEPIRVWVPACSTGEEAYSIAILFFEAFAATNRAPNLRIFASDVSPTTIDFCRSGRYPASIEADVSPERLASYFVGENKEYRVNDAVRDTITFAVQDLLADPPFSRIDLVSCRNLLIYLQSTEQENVLRLFHFALRDGGYLWLGAAETIGNLTDFFQQVPIAHHTYRRLARHDRQLDNVTPRAGGFSHSLQRHSSALASNKGPNLAAIIQRRLLDTHVPATIVVDSKNQCLYFFGPTDRYIRIPSGEPSRNILVMLREGLSAKYQTALRNAKRDHSVAAVGGGNVQRNGADVAVQITVQPLEHEHMDLWQVSFADVPAPRLAKTSSNSKDTSRIDLMEQELESSRNELADMIKDLESSNQELMEFNEEVVALNEEFMSTNEELETTREELQSLNEELTTSNSQLQESLEQRNKAANDLNNILASSAVATLFLDANLKIRYFTPAATPLFNLIPTDAGRPLADLSTSLVGVDLIADAQNVLKNRTLVKRDIKSSDGVWYLCSMSPYRSADGSIDGVVVNLADITDLKASENKAELANLGKSRFLAATSHNLRQPLQTLSLLLGTMARTITDEESQALLNKAKINLGVMSSMLSALLNINQLETGSIAPKLVDFSINEMLDLTRLEFADQMAERGLKWRVEPCSATIRCDRFLLSDMVRSLVSNAMRYTDSGSVLLGCRHHGDKIYIELWDTGIGIARDSLPHIFDDYFRATERASAGSLGLGLSIAHQIGELLETPLRARSHLGKGSVFFIEVPIAPAAQTRLIPAEKVVVKGGPQLPISILLIEDDLSVRESVELFLTGERHTVSAVNDGQSALNLVNEQGLRPDLVISDFNLAGAMNGVQSGIALRRVLGETVPVIILTGDIQLAVKREISEAGFIRRNKPVTADDLLSDIRKVGHANDLAPPKPAKEPNADPQAGATIYVVDDNQHACEIMQTFLTQAGFSVKTFRSAAAFLAEQLPDDKCCLVTDVCMPGMTGVELMAQIKSAESKLPIIVVTGKGDITMAVQAMRAGAVDFIEKPTDPDILIAAINQALLEAANPTEKSAKQADAANRFASLTMRESEVTGHVVTGTANKEIAAQLGISQRTVETHRANAMKKMGAASISDLVRLDIAAQ